MVAENMMIAAEELGYGTCYIGAVQNNTDIIARELELKPGVLPLYGLCIGVIDEAKAPPVRPRLPRDLCFFENTQSNIPRFMWSVLDYAAPCPISGARALPVLPGPPLRARGLWMTHS